MPGFEASPSHKPTRLPADLTCSIIGTGNMGSCFAQVIGNAALLAPEAVTLIDSGSGNSRALATRLAMNAASADYSSVANSKLVIIACPNRALPGILEAIAPLLQRDTLIVSTLAGTTQASWAAIGDKAKVVSIIPNPAFAHGASLSVVEYAPWSNFTAEEREMLTLLFSCGGSIFETSPDSPNSLPGASAISGCGPAFVAHQVIKISAQTAISAADLDLQIAGYSEQLKDAGTPAPLDKNPLQIQPELLTWGDAMLDGALRLGFSSDQARLLLRGALDGYLALRQLHTPEQVIPLVAHRGGTTQASIATVETLESFKSSPSWWPVIVGAAVRMGAPNPEIDFYDASH